MNAVAEKTNGNVIDFKALARKGKMMKALKNKPISFSEMSEKDQYESIQAMRDED